MSKNMNLKQKIAHHSLSIISLMIAIIALTYNTWRSDTTEYNRNIRTASFELIKELGQLQNITNQIHFSNLNQQQQELLKIQGWGHIALIEDLSTLLPLQISKASQELKQEWQNHHVNLAQNNTAESVISKRIEMLRESTRRLLIQLN